MRDLLYKVLLTVRTVLIGRYGYRCNKYYERLNGVMSHTKDI